MKKNIEKGLLVGAIKEFVGDFLVGATAGIRLEMKIINAIVEDIIK